MAWTREWLLCSNFSRVSLSSRIPPCATGPPDQTIIRNVSIWALTQPLGRQSFNRFGFQLTWPEKKHKARAVPRMWFSVKRCSLLDETSRLNTLFYWRVGNFLPYIGGVKAQTGLCIRASASSMYLSARHILADWMMFLRWSIADALSNTHSDEW